MTLAHGAISQPSRPSRERPRVEPSFFEDLVPALRGSLVIRNQVTTNDESTRTRCGRSARRGSSGRSRSAARSACSQSSSRP